MTALPWVRLDTSMPRNDKILALLKRREGFRTAFVYVCSLTFVGEQGTDGLISFDALPHIHGRKRDAEVLVDVGLWKPEPQGWSLPNWLDRQPTTRAVEDIRAARSASGTKANCIRWHGVDCGCWQRG